MLHVFVPRRSENVEAAKITAKAFREHDETLKSVSDAEIKSKDRVDIPLSEYERLKKENAELRARCDLFEDILKRVKINPEILRRVDPDTVQTFKMINPRDFTTTFRIEFDITDTYRDGARIKHVIFHEGDQIFEDTKKWYW